ncbi:conserved hypothetical protein [Ricinus communis]|uniref:Uncharacterized protein n=1 Tax=Ricinus communis TaxID=3988 RepID=B9T5I6_RICCO|nr:conserved hypothetical protein [Ricinus communis]
MAELQAVYRIDNVLTDSEMVAAQQLMQLSDEDNSSSINKNSSNRNRKNIYEDEELDRRSQDEITSKKIEEIFGKDEELEQERPKKKRFSKELKKTLMEVLGQGEDDQARASK